MHTLVVAVGSPGEVVGSLVVEDSPVAVDKRAVLPEDSLQVLLDTVEVYPP